MIEKPILYIVVPCYNEEEVLPVTAPMFKEKVKELSKADLIDENDKRNYGIDLLRILSMFMIVLHHVLVHGEILGNAPPLTLQYKAVWFLEIASFCAVNVYGMISGYVGYGKKHKLSRFLQLYLQVTFYTFAVTAIFAAVHPRVITRETILQAVFPFAFEYEMYWYYTAYFCMFFLMPFLDKMMETLSKAEAKRMMVVFFVIFSVLQTLFKKQFGFTNNGYSFLWLAMLYLVGAYISKYDLGKAPIKRYFTGYLLCVLFLWFVKMGVEQISFLTTGQNKEFVWLVNYTSPVAVICSTCLILAFKNLRCSKQLRRFSDFFAPVSFDVYLFHDEPFLRYVTMPFLFSRLLYLRPFKMVLLILAGAVGIWLAGSIIGKLREWIFQKTCVNRFCKYVELKLRRWFY